MKTRDKLSNRVIITFRALNKNKFIEEQDKFSDFLVEVVSHVIAIMFPYEFEFDKLKNMAMSDFAFFRSQTFSNSIFYGMEIFGAYMKMSRIVSVS